MFELKQENALLRAEAARLSEKLKLAAPVSENGESEVSRVVSRWMEWYYSSLAEFQAQHQTEQGALCEAAGSIYRDLITTQNKLMIMTDERDDLRAVADEKTIIVTELQTTMRKLLEDCRSVLMARECSFLGKAVALVTEHECLSRRVVELEQSLSFERYDREAVVDLLRQEVCHLKLDLKEVAVECVCKDREFAHLQEYHEKMVLDFRSEVYQARAEASEWKEQYSLATAALQQKDCELRMLTRTHQTLVNSLRSGISDLEFEAANLWQETEAQLTAANR